MGRLVVVTSLLLILLSGCSKDNNIDITSGTYITSEVISDNKHEVTYCDNEYTWTVDKLNGNILNKTKLVYEPALYFIEYNSDYTLTEIRPSSYQGTYKDICSYITYLTENNYQLVSLSRDNNYIDCTFSDGDILIRIIYSKNNEIKIFSKNSKNILVNPSYINGKAR